METNKIKPTEEKLACAKLLNIGTMVAFVLLVIFFAIYVTGTVKPHIPLAELPKYWGLSLPDYLEQTNYRAGWSWLNMLGKGDFLNFIAISLLPAITILCYIRIIPIFIRKHDTIYVVIAALEVVILVLAASGILVIGH